MFHCGIGGFVELCKACWTYKHSNRNFYQDSTFNHKEKLNLYKGSSLGFTLSNELKKNLIVYVIPHVRRNAVFKISFFTDNHST